MKLYQQLADDLTVLIRKGALKPARPRPLCPGDIPRAGLDKHPVRACWFMTSFQNPLGALVPDDARKELVQLLELHDVPLIEDDVYAELYFGSRRPKSTKAFDQKGLVLNCGSFSKSLAPGYRIGWVAAGRFARTVGRREVMSSLSTHIPAQGAIALYLRQGTRTDLLGQTRICPLPAAQLRP
jgi:DNA-binding transcriptional MocR family regulator